MANAHMTTPAMPPENMTVPRFKSAGDEPAGVNAFLVTSYVAKYLEIPRFTLTVYKEKRTKKETDAALPGPSRARVAPVPR
jgi:hypothetical protein